MEKRDPLGSARWWARGIAACLATALAVSSVMAAPEVTNHEDGSEVGYPVVLLKGAVSPEAESIEVVNESSDREERKLVGQVAGGKFKVLAELVPGENHLVLTEGDGTSCALVLNYRPATNPHYVRVIWMTDQSGETDYATSYPDDPQNYATKLDIAAKLLQTFTAERMDDTGYGRKTFRLELDDEGMVKVHTLAAPEEAAHYYGLADGKWYGEINRWLNTEHPDPLAKNIVIAAYTRKDPETGKMQAHTALGGGSLGLFGGASVFSWPDSLQDITATFLSDEKVDPARVHDDSAGRHTIWGLASTTLGATLHEMGHAFGLPHCQDPRGIMTRGFDRLNRAFTFVDPPGGRRLKAVRFEDSEVAYFAPISASFLQWSRWFQADQPSVQGDHRPVIHFDGMSEEIRVESKFPIRWLGLWQKDNVAKFKEFTGEQTEVRLSASEWKALLGADDLSQISAIGDNGIQGRVRLNREND